MNLSYTSEKNTQILIALMKAHGVKKIVASPGATNICLVWSLQQDPYFEIYSSVDERSAAYLACGLSAESGEPVALSCTGATASRNYVSGLTEAFYRKLPILAITSTQYMGRIGQNFPQVIDRTTIFNDVAKVSVHIPTLHNEEDIWSCEVQLNKALLELHHKGGGPVHINLETTYSRDFSIKELPEVRIIRRYGYGNQLPDLPPGRVGIVVGAHKKWSDELTKAVDLFCEIYDAVVICDHTSNYKGKYGVLGQLVCSQEQYISSGGYVNVLIHIGDISGAEMWFRPKQVWRVNPDGEIRDTYKKLTSVFEMKELAFFSSYSLGQSKEVNGSVFAKEWQREYQMILSKVSELPFSNAWIAEKTSLKIPSNSVLHLGILNTLRTWNFFEVDPGVCVYANTGGFGIDGNTSALIGASLSSPKKLYFGIIGDLSFFYDMNSVGNRHVGNNLRIMIINNGRGTEFRNYNHPAARFETYADAYMAAAGHYGKKSPKLIRHYAEDLGFEYLTASDKDEYLLVYERFLTPMLTERPIIFEVFTDSQEESLALKTMHNLEISASGAAKQMAKNILGEKGVKAIKNMMGK